MLTPFTTGALCSRLLIFVCMVNSAFAAEYEVGPGKKLTALGDVPWGALTPGDVVSIAWRPEPYREKFVLCVRGTAEHPIVVHGVPGPNGELPVLDGRDATTPATLDYWGGERSVIKVGGATKPADLMPAHIVIENLEVRSARPPYTFPGRKGVQKYLPGAAAISVEKVEHLVIRNCVLHDSGNGLFVSHTSRDLLIDGCRIYDNGIEKDIYEHNSYTETLGIVFQNNHYGPLRAGCPGNNLKDRSAGLVVRNNWIEGGNRALDLVDAADAPELCASPAYRDTYVYGNVLIKLDDAINGQVIHYGGDSGKTGWYRKGTLHFFHNTVVSRRSANTTLFGLSTDDESVDARNNIVWDKAGGAKLAICDGPGHVALATNWISRGWVASHGFRKGDVTGVETFLVGETPGFADEAHDDFHLAPESPCVGAAAALPPELSISQGVKKSNDLGAPLSH
jgi:hypothetical protein